MNPDKSRIEIIIDEINSTNAKKIAIILVLGFACYHGFLHFKYGTNSCQWLLSAGRYKGDQEWQPYGCMLHHYSKIDTRRCLRYLAFYGTKTHFIFIGDGRIRDLYNAFVEYLKQDDEISPKNGQNPPNSNLSHIDNKLKIKVDFVWAPLINKLMIDNLKQLKNNPPSVVVIGSALWAIKSSNGSKATLQEYRVNLTRLVQPIDSLDHRKVKVLWMLQESVNKDKLQFENQMITDEQVDKYNKAAIESHNGLIAIATSMHLYEKLTFKKFCN